MSPVNNDESSGFATGGADRPLTRKEIRAQEKFLATQNQEVIPPQAFATGQEATDAPAGAARDHAPEAPVAPERPEAVPTGHEPAPVEPVHDEPLHHEAASEEPVHQEPVHEAAHDDVVDDDTAHESLHGDARAHEPVHEYAGGLSREETLRRADELQYGHALHNDTFHDGHHDDGFAYPEHPADEDHDGYDEEPGRDLIGAASIPTAKGPSKKVRRRRRFLALVLTLAVFVVAIVVGAQFIKPLLGGNTVADFPGPGTGEVTITVPTGAGPKSVAADLQAKQVIANPDNFVKAFAASGGALSPGTFTMRKEMNNTDAVNILLNKDQGKVMYFALSAGMRINDSLQAISEGTGVPATELKALSDSPAQFGVPAKAKNLEGFLFPGEYRFPLGTSAKDILTKLVGSTLDELKAQGITDQAKQYDVVTVASIVQAEGGQAEYGDVAGAIYNRLKPNNTETSGLIQSDATVTYGLGIRSFHIDEAQKADKSNPYNTYANPGLPAGPIGSPGKTAIDAAAKPKTNDYLYWVTINLDTKETKFAKTLAEHNVNVAKYNAWCDANPNRCV
ncbi:MAG TPA: endolytic transglycosylase MltG [Arthrobacter sp.]|nr:endolytic transglycosylase MltG [Arthrobacter sp.]